MKFYPYSILGIVSLCGCANISEHSSTQGVDEQSDALVETSLASASTGRFADEGAESTQTFDEHLAGAIETYGRFRVIELKVLDAPHGSASQAVFDEVRLLRRAVDVPEGYGEVAKGVGRFVIAPLSDMQVLAARIDFGTIIKVDRQSRVITVRW